MLNKIEIEGLYGLYNYSLDLTQGVDKRLKIITGPNGYGKTTVLQLIYALFCKDTDLFYQIPFTRVAFFSPRRPHRACTSDSQLTTLNLHHNTNF